MTAAALQRVVVRMHHDPAFVDAVLRDPEAALAGVDVTAAERTMLAVPDRRAWGVDPARRGRVLEALRREYRVASALAESVAGTRGPLLGFFGSPAFHGAVQSRSLLAAAFGDWLVGEASAGRFGKRPTAETARLERAAVDVRRAPAAVEPGDGLVQAPWARVVLVREGTLDRYEAVFAALRAGGRVPARLRRLGGGEEWVVVERNPLGEVTFGGFPPALAALWSLAADGSSVEGLVAGARALGAEPGEAAGVVASLVEDRLLVPAKLRP